MFVAGDEMRRTQNGNNNAYCQDNATNWLDWGLAANNADLLRFWQRMIAFRKRYSTFNTGSFFKGAANERGVPEVTWHGTKLNGPGWYDPEARVLAFTLGGQNGDPDLHVMMNMFWEDLAFDLPTVPGRKWFRAIDTNQSSPLDIADPGAEAPVAGNTQTVSGRSIVVLVNR
jgi:glycogen operon protein